MPEFLTLLPPLEALEILLQNHGWEISDDEFARAELVLGRVTSRKVVAPHPLPSFRRATVDGYAVRASNTHGASETLPTYLSVKDEVRMGENPVFSLDSGFCALIHTGGMLPDGADAVIMVENTQVVGENEIEILKSVAVGENVIKIGEDVEQDDEILPAGTILKPAAIGGLMALGLTHVQVRRKPRVGIISTGDEVVPPDQGIFPGQVRDINTYTLSSLVELSGGEPQSFGIIPDDFQALQLAAEIALRECDCVIITAGSSASARDLTSQIISGLGPPGVLVHGVNIRPGKPTILGVCSGKAVIGLPGNPVSALVVAGIFVVPVIKKLLGISSINFNPVVSGNLKINLMSQAGREDWIPVKLTKHSGGFQVEPIFGKSNLIFTLARADGLIKVDADATGLAVGDQVSVYLL